MVEYVAGQAVMAAGIIDWISDKTTAIGTLVPNLLQTIVLLGVLVTAVRTRSWIKCTTFALGCALMLYLTGNLTWVTDRVKDEIQTTQSLSSVVAVVPDLPSSEYSAV